MVCELEWSETRLTVRAVGTFTPAELLRGVRDITADARYDDVRQVVVDFLDADGSTEGLLDAVEDLLVVMIGSSASNPNVRVAIVAAEPAFVDLVAALNSAIDTDPPALSCFPDRESVPGWLADKPRNTVPSARFRPR